MGIDPGALARLIRNPLVWLVVAVLTGSLLGWAAASASGGDRTDTAAAGRVVTAAIAGADVLLPSPELASSTAPSDG